MIFRDFLRQFISNTQILNEFAPDIQHYVVYVDTDNSDDRPQEIEEIEFAHNDQKIIFHGES